VLLSFPRVRRFRAPSPVLVQAGAYWRAVASMVWKATPDEGPVLQPGRKNGISDESGGTIVMVEHKAPGRYTARYS
jgi:hypothetical protein